MPVNSIIEDKELVELIELELASLLEEYEQEKEKKEFIEEKEFKVKWEKNMKDLLIGFFLGILFMIVVIFIVFTRIWY